MSDEAATAVATESATQTQQEAAEAPRGRDAILAAMKNQLAVEAKPDETAAEDNRETPAVEETIKPQRKPGFLRQKLESLTKELEAARANSRDSYIEALKKNPSLIFSDVGGDDLLLRLAEERGKQLDPVAATKAELEAKIAEVQKRLDDAKAAEDAARVAAETSHKIGGFHKALTEGLDEGGEKITPSWPLSKRLTEAGVLDVPTEAFHLATKLATDLGRKLSNKEAANVIRLAFDTIEKREAKKASAYVPPQETKPTVTISSKNRPAGGYAPATDRTARPVSARERHLAALRQKLNT